MGFVSRFITDMAFMVAFGLILGADLSSANSNAPTPPPTHSQAVLSECYEAVNSGAFAAFAQQTNDRCNCSRCNDVILCCSHAGVSARISAFERADEWAPRIADFNNCTGAQISVEFQYDEDEMAGHIIEDVGRESSDGLGIYDSYVIQAPWIPPVQSKLMDFTQWVSNTSQLRSVWNSMNPASKTTLQFGSAIRAIALDTDYVALGCRSDVFHYHNISNFPRTIEELVEVSERLNGEDHNNDGQPDWGTCFTPQANYFYVWLATVLQADGGCVSTSGGVSSENCQNMFFNTTTMEPLIDNPGVRYVMELFNRFMMSSNCHPGVSKDTPGYCNRKTAFPTGRCACVVSMPGTMSKILGSIAGHRYTINNSSMLKANLSDLEGNHWARRLPFPGSTKVYDPVNNALVTCTTDTCPKAKNVPGVGLVNYAPYFAEGGESYAIRAAADYDKRHALVDFFSWMSSLPINDVPLSGQYSRDQLVDPKASEFRNISISSGWPAIMVDDLLNVVLPQIFESDGNQVQDLLLPGFAHYMKGVEEAVYDNFMLLFSSTTSNQTLLAEQLRNHNDTWASRYDAFTTDWKTKMNAVTTANSPLTQLREWRKSLSLPARSDRNLCENLALSDSACNLYTTAAPTPAPGTSSDYSDRVRDAIISAVVVGVVLVLVLGAALKFRFDRINNTKKAQLDAIRRRVDEDMKKMFELSRNKSTKSQASMKSTGSASASATVAQQEHSIAKRRINRNQLQMGGVLGSGQYGVVKAAMFTAHEGAVPKKVAVKTLKSEDLTSEDQLSSFLFESALLATLSHPGIVEVIGIQDMVNPVETVLELLPGGSLLSCIRDPKRKAEITLGVQIRMMSIIANALAYLHKLRIVHCDIAARNILVGRTIDDVKLSDFGLSRQIMLGLDYYKKHTDDRLPIKWMAPEAILYKKFSTTSDVWSYGVLCWEIFSLGITPWSTYSSVEAVLAMANGSRMPLPEATQCPTQIYGLMLACWDKDSARRPKTADLSHMLEQVKSVNSKNENEMNWTIPDCWEYNYVPQKKLETGTVAVPGDLTMQNVHDYEYSPAQFTVTNPDASAITVAKNPAVDSKGYLIPSQATDSDVSEIPVGADGYLVPMNYDNLTLALDEGRVLKQQQSTPSQKHFSTKSHVAIDVSNANISERATSVV